MSLPEASYCGLFLIIPTYGKKQFLLFMKFTRLANLVAVKLATLLLFFPFSPGARLLLAPSPHGPCSLSWRGICLASPPSSFWRRFWRDFLSFILPLARIQPQPPACEVGAVRYALCHRLAATLLFYVMICSRWILNFASLYFPASISLESLNTECGIHVPGLCL